MCIYIYMYLYIYIYVDVVTLSTYTMIKGSLVGETSVLRTFRMSGKELVKERVNQRKS